MPHFALEDRKKENMMKIEKMKEKTESAKKRERERASINTQLGNYT